MLPSKVCIANPDNYCMLNVSHFLCLLSVSLLQMGVFARKNTYAAAGFVGGVFLGLASS